MVAATNEWIAVDVETATSSRDSLCSIAAVLVVDGEFREIFRELVKPPGNQYAATNMRIHGVTPTDTVRSRSAEQVSGDFWAFVGSRDIVAHNASFDADVIRRSGERGGVEAPISARWFCTLDLSRAVWPDLPRHGLQDLCDYLGIESEHHHADLDAIACGLIGMELLRVSGCQRFDELEIATREISVGPSSSVSTATSPFPENPKKIGPENWSDDEVAEAQRIVDLWLAGWKLKDIDKAVGGKSGHASTVLNRLRKNGLPIPKRSRGRGAAWLDEAPEVMMVRTEHLGKRNTLAKDTPADARIVVFTGIVPLSSAAPDRSQLETIAAEAGWLVRNRVTKRTTVLVRCDPTFEGGKVARAEELSTQCLTPEEFLLELRVPGASVKAR
jgi:DNA polymerase-3 subunit epsilon